MAFLASISIDAKNGRLVIEYDEYDDRQFIGTRYAIPIDLDPLNRRLMVTAEGFSGETTHHLRTLARGEIPDNVIADAKNWLGRQLEIARGANKRELTEVLRRFQAVLQSD